MDFNEFNHSIGSSDSLWDEKYDFDLANLITKARIYAGLTQDKLAKRMGISQSTVAQAENGSFLPSHTFLKRVAVAVETSLLAPSFSFMQENYGVSTSSKTNLENNQFIAPNMNIGEYELTNLKSKSLVAKEQIKDKDIWKIS